MLSSISNALQSFSKTPISDYAISGVSKVIPYVSLYFGPSKETLKLFTHFPEQVLGNYTSQTAIFGVSGALAFTAFKSNDLKSRIFYGSAALLAASLGIFEILKFRNIGSCFNSFKCDPDWTSSLTNSTVPCSEQAEKFYYDCTHRA
ncbi:MAG: hypothetical protein K1060chlam1_00556 [Candidatus Anoxychlamydiales bacterium]|nr:hypothetical protein [Candidatus Anoxychlamydiales bacterium]